MLSLLKIDCSCDEAVSKVHEMLLASGLRVMTSFDSSLTRETGDRAGCPHHGTAACDCQIIILLVYDLSNRPATLFAHGQDGETWISLVTAAGQRPPARLENKIRQALPSS